MMQRLASPVLLALVLLLTHPIAGLAATVAKLMKDRGLPVPPKGGTRVSICITDLCKGG